MNVIFMDRDGTVIVDPPDERVDNEEKIKLFPDTLQAMKELAARGYTIVFVTNQAGIAEGRVSEHTFWELHTKILELLKPSGIHILKTFVCPHRPEDTCTCRKPQPTMLLQAAKEFDIDLSKSWFIGDRATDVQAGQAAGVRAILVQTANTPQSSAGASYVAPHLLDAVRHIEAKA